MIENIQFKKIRCNFLDTLRQDTNDIKKSETIYAATDKTTNYYKLRKEQYSKLVSENITAKYRKADNISLYRINSKAKQIASDLDLAGRIEKLAPKPAFITIKDHKENFPNHIQCRLINPAKSEIGIINKCILDRINTDIIKATKIQQWKSTQAVIKWYQEIPDKQACSFFGFDVVEFYPSISETLLQQALQYASGFTQITPREKEVIISAKSTLLFHENYLGKSQPSLIFSMSPGHNGIIRWCRNL
ncbi:hypothetical protein HOLleu_08541 [Holothuria leucospilota]|uniref:Uncharacterized protein n=1 Tax=Holothuria leucospilota TaxID=206669 RepID=A0A9Q1CIU5_HOLLE|nr:hypothetical protein HOLleu_08541 [Holothuria leucospilota]